MEQPMLFSRPVLSVPRVQCKREGHFCSSGANQTSLRSALNADSHGNQEYNPFQALQPSNGLRRTAPDSAGTVGLGSDPDCSMQLQGCLKTGRQQAHRIKAGDSWYALYQFLVTE